MNYYCITYRLDTDSFSDKRYYEGYAESFELAVNDLVSNHRLINSDLFSRVIIISKSVYKSVFK